MESTRQVSLAFRVVLGLGVVCLALLPLMSWWVQVVSDGQTESAVRSRLELAATSLAAAVDGDVHEGLMRRYEGEDDLSTWSADGSARRLHRLFADVEERGALRTPIYTLRLRDEVSEAIRASPTEATEDAMEFGVASNDEPYWRHRYQYRPEMAPALFDGRASSTTRYVDENGTWVSAYAPVFDSQGRVVAIVEMDAKMEHVLAEGRASAFRTQGSLLIPALLVFIAVMFYLAWALHPLKRVGEVVEAVGRGDLTQRVDLRRSGEVGRIARVVDRTAKRLADALREQEATERRLVLARDEANAASSAKSAFLATMSHEIRTPLNGVLGTAQLLEHTRLDGEQSGYLRTLIASGEHLLLIINDVLDFSKIEAGQVNLEAREFDLVECVHTKLTLVATLAHHKGLELVLSADPAVSGLVRGDSMRVGQLVLNLVNNAIKFTDAGSVVVRLLPCDVGLRIEVQDTGIGIPADRLHRLFLRFSQADDSTTRQFGGTGLGLAICKHLAEAMGGCIGVRSTAGQGSTFWIDLPLAVVPQVLPVRGAAAVLLEPNAEQAQALCQALKVAGYGSVEVVGSLAELTSYDWESTLLISRFIDDRSWREAMDLAARGHAEIVVVAPSNERDLAMQAAGVLRAEFVPLPACSLSFLKKLDATETLEAVDALRIARGCVRIVLAEDVVLNQVIATRLLARAGYTDVVLAKNGREAVERVQSDSDVRLVLMDCQMPVLDGLDATRAIRASGMADLKIVAMTANASSDDRQACVSAGMDDFLCKPVVYKDLLRTLDRYLLAA